MTPSRSASKRVLVGGLGILAFLLVGMDGRATTAEPKRSGPWKLAALRQSPKVAILDQGKTLTSLYYGRVQE